MNKEQHEPERVQRLVDKHLDDYELKSFTATQEALKKEMEGKGCGCHTCKHLVVREMNRWVDWLAKENAEFLTHYRVNEKGLIEGFIPAKEKNGAGKAC